MNMKFDTRQKIVAVLLAIVAIILVWQLYDLFAVDNKNMPVAPAPIKTSVINKPAVVTAETTAAQFARTTNNLPANASTSADNGAAVNPTNTQAEYLRLVTEYQMAQLQRMIAEDNEAIAIARQNAAKAMSETSKLMGTGTISTATDSAQNNNDYQLVYTGQQADNSWTATLKKNGQNTDVVVGGHLNDGSQVLAIDDNGVLLQQGNIKKLVTFSGVTTTTAQPINSTNKIMPSSTDEIPVKKDEKIANLPKIAAAPKPLVVMPAQSQEAAKPVKLPVKETAEKTAAALSASPEHANPPSKAAVEKATQPKKIKIIDKNVNEEKKPVEKKTAVVTKDAPKTVPVTVSNSSNLLPLQQPIVAFPHSDANQQKNVKALVVKKDVTEEVPTAVINKLLAVNPNNYTIQLTGDHELNNLKLFIKKYKLENKTDYFRTYDMDKKDLYILIYGEYSTLAAAQTALAELPAGVKAEGAFIVKYSTIQTVLKKTTNDNIKK